MGEPVVVDLLFRGQARVIATAVLRSPSGVVLVDPGPASCLPALEAGLASYGVALEEVQALLLTHIHLDHAGATGMLVARRPDLEVVVHERGAPHLVAPAKLLASAARLYGEAMEALWGPFVPTPAANLRVVRGGERLAIAGLAVDVAYTPGHAVHHVSYLERGTGVAYVGDTAGIRVAGDCVIAPTPPPDIDLDAWAESLRAIEAWRPGALVLTHFGRIDRVEAHLAQFRGVLARSATLVRATLDSEKSDPERARTFAEQLRADVAHVLPAEEARATELAAPFEPLWLGLARYFRTRAASGTVPGTAARRL